MQNRPEPIGPTRKSNSTAIAYFLLAIVGLLLFVFFMRSGTSNRGGDSPAIGQALPALVIEPLTGNPPPLTTADLQGKVSLVNFWGPWCYFCLKEMPHLVELKNKYADEPVFQLISISCSQYWGPRDAGSMAFQEDIATQANATRRYLEQENFSLATYADPQGRTRSGFTKLAPWQGYPTTLLIDTQGIIRAVWIGFSPGDEQAMEDTMRGLLRTR